MVAKILVARIMFIDVSLVVRRRPIWLENLEPKI